MWKLAIVALVLAPIARASGPTSSLIVFTTSSGNVTVAAPDGTGRVTLGQGFAASWSPDGSRVAFAKAGNNTEGIELWVANADGTDAHAITSGAAPGDGRLSPTWSPDGTEIAFVRYYGSAVGTREIWIVPANGGVPRLVTARGGGVVLGWQPHGTLLLYVATDENNVARMWTVDAATGTTRALAEIEAGRIDVPAWSPDGTQAAFIGSRGQLGIVNADGTGRRDLDAGDGGSFIAWAPDGRSIALAESRTLQFPPTRFGQPSDQDLFVVDVTTGAERRLTGWYDPNIIAPASSEPSWWPDGSRLFFRSGRGSGVWEMNADGSCEHTVPGLGDAPSPPSWRPGQPQQTGPLGCVQLRVRVSVDRPQIAVREQGVVEVTIENDGNQAATGVVVSVAGQPETTATVPCGRDGTPSTCTLGTIGPGGTRTVNAYLSRPGAGPATATLKVRSGEANLTPEDTEATLVEQVLPCSLVGTWTADVLTGTPDDDYICGLPGPDRISGGRGEDYLNGGSGADTIIGGPGRDTILGGGGADVIEARDHTLDWIDCGTENDIAIVDRADRVHHCEKVLRS